MTHNEGDLVKILIFGPYPIVNPIHGGQLRAKAIADCYVANGFEVRYCGITGKKWYKHIDETDIEVDISYEDPSYQYALDVMMSTAIERDAIVMKALRDLIHEFEPDIIQIEQPYMFPAVRPMIDAYKEIHPVKLIYSSQNIEADMKQEILDGYIGNGLTSLQAKRLVDATRKIETSIASCADLTIACTKYDSEILKGMGARNVIVCHNGINEIEPNEISLNQWKETLATDGISRFALFVGSGHPPNATGFTELIGYALGDLPRSTRVYVAGGVCGMLEDHLKTLPAHVRHAFLLRVSLLGVISNEDLTSLLTLANTILLPITSGGGSNLKTAEALLAGKTIIATETAFRSYESYKKLKHVHIANTHGDFRAALHRVMCGINKEKQAAASPEVTWKYTLSGLAKRVSRV